MTCKKVTYEKATVSCWKTQRVIIGLVQHAKPQAFTHALVQ